MCTGETALNKNTGSITTLLRLTQPPSSEAYRKGALKGETTFGKKAVAPKGALN